VLLGELAEHGPEIRQVIVHFTGTIRLHCDGSLPARALLDEIAARVPGYRRDPRPESIVISERSQFRKSPHERLLRQIFRVRGVARHRKAYRVHALSVQPHEPGKGPTVPRQARLDDCRFPSAFQKASPSLSITRDSISAEILTDNIRTKWGLGSTTRGESRPAWQVLDSRLKNEQ
jgi:hypothetical protein